jgi:glycosyltransferase involved in cell wall biosynthesis
LKVYIEPRFEGQDQGEGGIRRVVEAQRAWLPKMGIEVVDNLGAADLVATHAAVATTTVPVDIPWVVHTHGLYWSEYAWTSWPHKLNGRVISAIRQADHVTAPSEWVAQALRRGMWLQPTVLHHGIDEADWLPGTNGGYVLWNKTRVDPICDPSPIITLAKMNPAVHFISTYGAEGLANLELTGVLPYQQAREWVRDAGVYLCTTRETFGIGTIEAMAAGVPVVGWDWGGQREIIDHRVNGWLAPVGDYAGLTEGIQWALENREAVGAEARRKVLAMFTWERAMSRYVSLYEGVCGAVAERSSAPRVSIIVPCYNLAKYLPDTIKSLQAQSMSDWEAIIVNDASTDDTERVANALAAEDRRVRAVHLAENQYLAGALNEGVRESQGRYILPLDADNMVDANTLARLSSALDSDRMIDIAYGGARFVLEDGTTPDTSVGAGGVSGWPTAFSFMGQIQGRNQIPSTAMYRRRVWDRSGGYRRRWRTSEDADFWTRAVSLGFQATKVSPRPTLVYRQREESMSRVNPRPDYPAWYPWSRRKVLTPFGVADKPPASINEGLSWVVPSAEPAKVGVIIPVGPGHQELVIDALDSVEAQTYRSWQVIVVNDTGERLEIPHTWANVLHADGLPDRLGPGAARNSAIAMLDKTVKWFVPLDADDYLQADAIDVMVRAWEDGGGVIYSQWYDDFGDEVKVYDPPDYDARLLLRKGMIHAVTALYPVDAWREVGGFDTTLTHWEDWDFHLRLANAGICGTRIPVPLWTYRKTKGKRREQNRATFDEGKNAILDRWRPYWEGGKTLMACQGCPGGGGNRYAKPPSVGGGGSAPARAPEGYKSVDFHGQSTGTREYKGAETGTRYRFGNNAGHRRKFVYEKDVPGLLAFMDGGVALFSVVAEDIGPLQTAPPLEAVGPPETPPVVHDAPMAQVEGPDLETDAAKPAATAVAEPQAAQGGDPAATRNPTVKELRDMIKAGLPSEELTMMLMKEKMGEKRSTALTLLEAALREAQGL